MPLSLQMTDFGGINQYDYSGILALRSYQQTQGGLVQTERLDSPNLKNMNIYESGVGQRGGQTVRASITTTAAADVIFAGCVYRNVDGTTYEILVSTKTIWYGTAGGASFAQMNVQGGGSAYTHSSDCTACTFAALDGHLFIGLKTSSEDAQIQVYRSGTAFDDEMLAGEDYQEAFSPATTHVIDGTWATNTWIIAAFADRLLFCTGTNYLEYTPEATSTGSGIWQLSTGGFISSSSEIRSIIAFSPQYSDSYREMLYIGTGGGFQVTTGVSDPIANVEGTPGPRNHRSFAKTENWLMYMSDDNRIMGLNGVNVIDIGRRLNSKDGDGYLDNCLTRDDSGYINHFGYYNKKTKQAWFFGQDTASRTGNTAYVIDLSSGEPLVGESQPSFEKRVRCFYWTVGSNSWFVHAWDFEESTYAMLYSTESTTKKILNTEVADENDYISDGAGTADAAAAIASFWETPEFSGGIFSRLKQWRRMNGLFDVESAGTLIDINAYLDRGGNSSWSSQTFAVFGTLITITADETIAAGETVEVVYNVAIAVGVTLTIEATATYSIEEQPLALNSKRIDLRSLFIRFRFGNDDSDKTFTLNSVGLHYDIGSEIQN